MSDRSSSAVETFTLPVSGMSCAACSSRVQLKLDDLAGLEKASVNLTTHRATVTGTLSVEEVVRAVRETGFEVPVLTERFLITGISCASCVTKTEAALGAVPGVEAAAVNLAAGDVSVTYIPELVSFERLEEAVAGAGYGLVRAEAAEDLSEIEARQQREEVLALRERFLVGAKLMLTNMILMHGLGDELLPWVNHWAQLLLITPVQFWVGMPFHRGAWAAAKHGTTNMNSLITVGTFSAYIYSVIVTVAPDLVAVMGVSAGVYFDTAGMIIVLILMGRLLEARAKGRTSQAIKKLMGLAPTTARVLENGEEIEKEAAELQPGDVVVIRPGERIPVDGSIVEGGSSLDESMVTGESMPVTRGPGEPVIGGTINGEGSFTFAAERVGKETMLARIVEMVREAQGAKPPIARLADKIAAYFVPAVMGVASLTFLVWFFFGPEPALTYALVNFIAVMIIACPCALGLATPTSIMVGTGMGAEHGILIRGGESLETAHKVNAVIFDKTGTLTQGQPILTDWSGSDADLALVAAAEVRSEHPLARAMVDGARARGIEIGEPDAFKAMTGRGVRAKVGGRHLFVGTRALMKKAGVDVSALEEEMTRLEGEGKTAMLVGIDKQAAGVLAVADTLKPESVAAVASLREKGIRVALLTGDNRRTAEAIAHQAGIDEVHAEVLPGQKAGVVETLQEEGYVTAMVGDGINDAPALARADVGIAIGTGADVAMEAADVTLITGDPRGVVTAVELSRATIRNIKQNLFWAFAYNVILIPVAAGVLFPWFGILLSPIFAAAAMGMSSVTVVSNALRLKRFRPSH